MPEICTIFAPKKYFSRFFFFLGGGASAPSPRLLQSYTRLTSMKFIVLYHVCNHIAAKQKFTELSCSLEPEIS